MRRNGIRNFDVAVVGGGPAGAALAIELVRSGHSTTVIERSNYRGARIGETLPPSIQPLLVRLGLWDRFLAQKHLPTPGICSIWGRGDSHYNDFVFNPYGAGWHVDRNRFDSMLARCAEEAGAIVHRDARASRCARTNGNWEIEVVRKGRSHPILARFLVDASGRTAELTRGRFTTRINVDHLIGVIKFFAAASAPPSDHFTLIEAVETGWWYSAVLPDSSLVAAYMTDADLYATGRRHLKDFWRTQLRAARHTRSRVSRYDRVSRSCIVPANSSRLDRAADKNWMAIGDAAMAFDPLSGQGVYKALESASRAAQTIDEYLSGNKAATRDYALAVTKTFESYLRTRTKIYGREKRWPNAPFWRRRQSARK